MLRAAKSYSAFPGFLWPAARRRPIFCHPLSLSAGLHGGLFSSLNPLFAIHFTPLSLHPFSLDYVPEELRRSCVFRRWIHTTPPNLILDVIHIPSSTDCMANVQNRLLSHQREGKTRRKTAPHHPETLHNLNQNGRRTNCSSALLSPHRHT